MALRIRDALAAPSSEELGPSLADGESGLALFFANFWRATGRDADAEAALTHLRKAIDSAADRAAGSRLSASLFSGQAGVAWTIERLGADVVQLEGDPNEGVDRALVELLSNRWEGPHDLVDGLVGFGTYALVRLPRASAEAVLELVLRRLAESAHPGDGGVTWWTPGEALPGWQRRDHPEGYFDVGVAHGVAGVIAFLGRCMELGVAEKEARPLLDGAVSWLLAHRLPAGAPSSFPAVTSPRSGPSPARSAWCYGDPGIAAALLAAGHGAGEPAWVQEAVTVAVRAAARSSEESAVVDAGLCHGSAGLAHVFNRLFATTGERRLADASRLWVDETFRLLPKMLKRGFLEGTSGAALALLAAATDVEPSWDQVLLLS